MLAARSGSGESLNRMALAESRAPAFAKEKAPDTSRFDQWLLDAILDTPLHGAVNRGRFLMLQGIREMRLSVSDPLVNYAIGPCRLRIPLSHELPFYRQKFPEYGRNLGEISFHVRQKYPDLTMIDVGANIGDSVAIIRSYSDHPILCVEGEPGFFSLLQQNTRNLPGIELEQSFLGAKGDLAGNIYAERGNARLTLGSTPGGAPMKTLSEVVSRHPAFGKPKLIKLDAEGFDCRIIAAESALLRRAKPVLFFEYYPKCCELTGQKALSVFPQLSALGYSIILIYQNVGRYFMSLKPDQVDTIEDLHQFIAGLDGFCDVVAFHVEDLEIAREVRAARRASLGNDLNKAKSRERDA